MKKETIIYIAVLVLSVASSVLFSEFAPDFNLKGLVAGLIVIVPVIGYTAYYNEKTKTSANVIRSSKEEFLSKVDPENPTPFERVVMDFNKIGFKENFRYMKIEESGFFKDKEEFKLYVSGRYNLKVKEKDLKIDLLFVEGMIYIDFRGKEVSEKRDLEYSKKSIYKVIEKEIFDTINNL